MDKFLEVTAINDGIQYKSFINTRYIKAIVESEGTVYINVNDEDPVMIAEDLAFVAAMLPSL